VLSRATSKHRATYVTTVLLLGPEWRPRWSDDDKEQILFAALARIAAVSEIAKHLGVSRRQSIIGEK
jgi:transposase-like protein